MGTYTFFSPKSHFSVEHQWKVGIFANNNSPVRAFLVVCWNVLVDDVENLTFNFGIQLICNLFGFQNEQRIGKWIEVGSKLLVDLRKLNENLAEKEFFSSLCTRGRNKNVSGDGINNNRPYRTCI